MKPYTPIRFTFPAADLTPSCTLTDTQLLNYINDASLVFAGVHPGAPGERRVCLDLGNLGKGEGEGATFREALQDLHAKTLLDVVTAKLSL